MGIFKSNSDLKNLKEASRIAGFVLGELLAQARPDVSTVGLEVAANKLLGQHRSSAPFKQFDNFNNAICISINDEVVNGPPSRERVLKEGDVVSIAIGTEYRGLHGKAAGTIYVGSRPPEDVERLLKGTRALFDHLEKNPAGYGSLNELLGLIPKFAKQHDLRVIRDTFGTGIGKKLHEAPYAPNDPEKLEGIVELVPGMAVVLMPMMTLGETDEWVEHEDKWTHVMKDGSLAAHFAETLLVTENGIEILTRSENAVIV